MSESKIICLDPGHGMGNTKAGVYDPGAESGGFTEAGVCMQWVNELRAILMAAGHRVIRTRVDAKDPAPVWLRAGIAKRYDCDVMLCIHCNDADGKAQGTESYYRGPERKALALACNSAVVGALGTVNRGVKNEAQSQHPTLAVMSFPNCVLVEIGFIDNTGDRKKLLDPVLRLRACVALAAVLTA